MQFQKQPNIVTFSMGDADGAGTMGVLVSLTLAVCGLLITLILAVQYALAMSVLKKGALTNLKVKMRPGYLYAPIVLFFFFYLPVIA